MPEWKTKSGDKFKKNRAIYLYKKYQMYFDFKICDFCCANQLDFITLCK